MNNLNRTGFTPELLKEVEEVLEQEKPPHQNPRRTEGRDKPLQRLIAESSLYDMNPRRG